MSEKEMSLTYDKLVSLESVDGGPCLSIYQETHRSHPDNQQDPIRFRNSVKQLKLSLLEKYPDANMHDSLKALEALGDDFDFWAHTWEGLAILCGQDRFEIFRLQRPVADLIVVGDSFHLNPLRRYLQSVDRFQILCLSINKIQLFEGNRNTLDEIVPQPAVPITIASALGSELSEPEKSVSSHAGTGHGTIATHHGYSDKQNEIDIDTQKYFRAVDTAVLEHHSRPTKLPLILACLPEHHKHFRKISDNHYLLAEGLDIDPFSLSVPELRERAWLLFEPGYAAQLKSLADDFLAAKAKGLASDDLVQVEQAAADGRVQTLLIEADRLDEEFGSESLENLAEIVAKMGGKVQIIPAATMPGQTGLAATYRYGQA